MGSLDEGGETWMKKKICLRVGRSDEMVRFVGVSGGKNMIGWIEGMFG